MEPQDFIRFGLIGYLALVIVMAATILWLGKEVLNLKAMVSVHRAYITTLRVALSDKEILSDEEFKELFERAKEISDASDAAVSWWKR